MPKLAKLLNPALAKSLYWIIGLGLFLRIIAAVYSDRIIHPDELFQVLEPANKIVFGAWTKAWEWDSGLRSWFLPGLIAGCLKLLSLVGVEDPISLSRGVRIFVSLFSLLNIVAAFRIGKILSEDIAKNEKINLKWAERLPLLCALFFAAFPRLIYYSVHPLSDSVCLPFLLWALVLVLERKNNWTCFWAGTLLGIAYGIRYQSALFFPSSLLILFLSSPWKRGLQCIVAAGSGFTLLVMMFGFLDFITWGMPFSSVIHYLQFNLIEHGASRFGEAPWYAYFQMMNDFFSFPLSILLVTGSLFCFYPKNRKRSLEIGIFSLPFLIVHFSIAHKEERFLLPLYASIMLLGVDGSLQLLAFFSPEKRRILNWIFAVIFIESIPHVAFTQNWEDKQSLTTFYQYLHDAPNLRGILIYGRPIVFTGGHFNLQRSHVNLEAVPASAPFPFERVPKDFNYLGIYLDREQILETLSKKGISCQPLSIPENSDYQGIVHLNYFFCMNLEEN